MWWCLLLHAVDFQPYVKLTGFGCHIVSMDQKQHQDVMLSQFDTYLLAVFSPCWVFHLHGI